MRDLSFESSVWSEKAAQLGRWEVQEEGLFVKLGCIMKLMGNFKQVWVLKRTLSLCAIREGQVRREDINGLAAAGDDGGLKCSPEFP